MTEAAPPRTHSLREVFNAWRWIVRAGAPWRMRPNDLPPGEAVYHQPQRWLTAGVVEAIGHDVRTLLRLTESRTQQPSAAMPDRRTWPSSPESGTRAGYDGAKRKRGSNVHMAVAPLGHLLAVHVTAADEQDRTQVKHLAEPVQEVTGHAVEVALVDQGDTGEQPVQDAAEQGRHLAVVKLPEAKPGFVLLPRRWVVARSFVWAGRFRRLAREYERRP
jgi:transposase